MQVLISQDEFSAQGDVLAQHGQDIFKREGVQPDIKHPVFFKVFGFDHSLHTHAG
jgi:hypothetical protein